MLLLIGAPRHVRRRVLGVLAALVWIELLGVARGAPARAGSCSVLDVACHLGNLAGDFLTTLAQGFVDGVATLVLAITAGWVALPTPELASDAAGTATGPVAFLRGSLAVYTLCLATVSVALCLVRIAWANHAGHSTGAVKQLSRVVLSYLAVSTLGLAVLWAVVQGGDEFAPWILASAAGSSDFGTNLTLILALGTATGIGGLLLAFLAFVDMIGSVLQLVAMIARGALLVVAAGVWPTAAASMGTEAGEQWFRKITAWITGLALYKYAAGIIYATGVVMTGQHLFGNNGVINVVTGMFLLFLSAFALPALSRFAVPLVAAVNVRGGGGGGALAGAASGAVAAGATVVAGYVQSRGSSSGPPPGAGPPTGGGGGGGWGGPPPGAGPTGPAGAGGGSGAGAAGAAGAAGPAGAAAAAGTQLVGAVANGAHNTADKATGEGS